MMSKAKFAQGGKNRVRRDRTGDRYGGLVVLGQGPRRGNLLSWSCRCLACGKEFVIDTTRIARKARAGEGCGCRQGERLKLPPCTCQRSQ